jgi:hypothetical protein
MQEIFALRAVCVVSAVLLAGGTPAPAQDAAPVETEVAAPSEGEFAIPTEESKRSAQRPKQTARDDTDESLCLIIESAAKTNDLPLDFFARVIWQESRFRADAVGPMTRRGSRAQGIAQFMPGTAAERRLLDPFDPVQALPKSAEFLRELRAEFGNLGLAAAAYNAGPRRVQEWMAGTGPMPAETRAYVAAITGMTIDDWAAAKKNRNAPTSERPQAPGCRQLMALLKRAPNPFVEQLEQRVAISALRPWGVQLAAGYSRSRALQSYARAMSQLRAVVGDRDPSILATTLRRRGSPTFYQVRIGADTRAAADDVCARIRRVGGACLVLRNTSA